MVAGTSQLRVAFEIAEGIGDLGQRTSPVDREAGVIYGVKVAGFESRNKGYTLGLKREEFGDAVDQTYAYTRGAYEKALPLYEGARVYISHPKFRYTETGQRVPIPDSRDDDAFLGWLQNVRVMETGVYADFHYLKTHPFAERVLEVAERNPAKMAMSHEALFGNPALINGRIYLQEIMAVEAIALVTAVPGTTHGLFESAAGRAAECTCGKCAAGMAVECGGEGSGKPGPCPGPSSGSGSGGSPGPRTKAIAKAVRGRRSQSDLAIRNLKLQASGRSFPSQSAQAIANLQSGPGASKRAAAQATSKVATGRRAQAANKAVLAHAKLAGFDHLNVVNSDRADFQDTHVSGVRKALHAASGGKLTDDQLTGIAKKHLGISTLVPVNSDRHDFHEVHRRSMGDAIRDAQAQGKATKASVKTSAIAGSRAAARAAKARTDGESAHLRAVASHATDNVTAQMAQGRGPLAVTSATTPPPRTAKASVKTSAIAGGRKATVKNSMGKTVPNRHQDPIVKPKAVPDVVGAVQAPSYPSALARAGWRPEDGSSRFFNDNRRD